MDLLRVTIYFFKADYERASRLVKRYKIKDRATLIRECLARYLEATAKEIGRK